VELSNCTSESRKRLQKWQRAIGRFMLLAKQRSYETLHLCASHGKHAAAPAVLFSLWRSLVRPLLEIGSELWSPEIGKVDKDKIEKLQYKFARRATSLPDSTPLPFLRGEMGLSSIGTSWRFGSLAVSLVLLSIGSFHMCFARDSCRHMRGKPNGAGARRSIQC
jgi:hypothetical protein